MKLLYQNVQTKKAIEQLAKEAKEIRFAVAFWGKGASETIVKAKGKKIKIICNIESGATNPYEIIKIGKMIGFKNIRSIKNLHAKVYLTDSKMILGSSNFSANGLSLEGNEADKLIEANVLIDNRLIIKQAESWFNSLWSKGKPVNEKYCKEFLFKWFSNRNRNQKRKNEINIFKAVENGGYSKEKIYITINTMGFTKEEEKIGDQEAKKTISGDLYYSGKEISYWHGYPKVPREAYVIDYFYSKKKKLTYYGIYKTLPKMYDKKGFQFCYKTADHPLRKAHLQQIKKILMQNITKMKIPPEYGLEIELGDFYEMFKPKEN